MFGHNRTRKPRHHDRSCIASVPTLPPRRRNDHYDQSYAYGWTAAQPSSQCFDDIPLTPPPPYDNGLANERIYPMPTPTLYQQLAPVQKESKLRKKPSAWASAKELAREVQQSTKKPYGQEQRWQSSGNMVTRPSRSRLDECPVVGTLVQSSAICDRVTAVIHDALHDAFSKLEHEEDDDRGSLPEAARGMAWAAGAHSLERTTGGSIIDFKKTWLYSNSRLPPHMPPVKLYLDTWQLVCSAAKASLSVYRRPRKEEKQDYIDADWRAGTKAMLVHSRPVDDKNLIVIAIRGSKWNIFDWAVNFHPAPTEPTAFLDDEGNACHAGFLRVSRSMIAPIAARLRDLLQQDPSRAASSLLFTGHSAGGAVAQLLFSHMMATTVESELNLLTGCFKRVHCITFGVPPVTFLPLSVPGGKRFEKNVFLSFVSEGDPVVRADQQYLTTLTRLIAASAPTSSSSASRGLKYSEPQPNLNHQNNEIRMMPFRWDVPPATLSCGGRLVLLRQKPASYGSVEAVSVTDEELRDVVFGDVSMHSMEIYKHRIDDLAIAAVTGRPA